MHISLGPWRNIGDSVFRSSFNHAPVGGL
jgi:hypothetical protein